MAPQLPSLREIPLSGVLNKALPTPKVKTEEEVELWKTTRGYGDLGLFLQRLNKAVIGQYLPFTPQCPSQHVGAVLAVLDTLDTWIDEAPPLQTPQRFGNLAFRTWGKRLEDNVDQLLSNALPVELCPAIPYLSPYFLTSFGSFLRMDYGSGHETSFAIFLLCLSLLRFFTPEQDEERQVVLLLFVRYLRLCWRLQDVYNLEPAGSHGVWGLDDYSFLGYIFGSGQLRDQTDIPVSAVLNTPLPPTNLYFMQIMRIHEVKHGPFHEHSSQLYSIATGVPNWGKVNSGLFKMYQAEVLGKRVVVQHIPLGGLMEWETSVDRNSYVHHPHQQMKPTTALGPPAVVEGARVIGSHMFSRRTSLTRIHPTVTTA
ncbi:Phosphotyrosyl phosphatase activator [Thelephora ganbajun]|uniref:Phosphotyrosyl phosphatase activator n=1 Tax=Thelephora ganbajun TaxID=370292 RepID=A0ACB6ZLC7_THEGA|nr:Phosphotyrosyl phosphatase activator [Thelephora ganbajun]